MIGTSHTNCSLYILFVITFTRGTLGKLQLHPVPVNTQTLAVCNLLPLIMVHLHLVVGVVLAK